MIITAETLISRVGRRPFTHGGIVIGSGKIVDLGNGDHLVRKYPGHRVIRLDHAVLMPGLVNVHAHLELPPLFDRIHGKDYPSWVLNLLKEKSLLSFRDYAAASRTNLASVIESGTTTIAEICTHGASPRIVARSGLRAIVYHEVISLAQDARALIVPQIQRGSSLVRQGLSPHSPHTVSEPVLNKICRIASKRRLPVSMHVAETRDEVRLLRGSSSALERLYAAAHWKRDWAPRARSPFAYLQRTGILGPSFLAVHAVHADADDITIIKRSGASIAHCPRSNHALGVGRMPLAKVLRAGIPVGLGTDSLASVPSLNLWDEMRYAYRIHRSSGITAEDVCRLATLGGAKAIGMELEIGSLEPGKQADCIALALPRKMTGDLYSDLLREASSCIMSMVQGRIIYRARAPF